MESCKRGVGFITGIVITRRESTYQTQITHSYRPVRNPFGNVARDTTKTKYNHIRTIGRFSLFINSFHFNLGMLFKNILVGNCLNVKGFKHQNLQLLLLSLKMSI